MAPARKRLHPLAKVGLALGGLAVLGLLFWRSVHSAGAEPYTLSPDTRGAWRLSIEGSSRPNDPVLVLMPPSGYARELFDQVFKRSMESMSAPDLAGMPLVLQGELERAGAERITPDALLAMARQAGLEAAVPTPRCLAHRRAPEPDTREQLFFVTFDSPAFKTFRWNLASRLGAKLEADFVTPMLLIGTVQSPAQRWLPLEIDEAKDCVAPIVSTGAATGS
ncbi:MAG TPA: hypothetical protein VLA14_03285 [Polyangia bacterium]|nr:hypothetical protein [Polyangia bacterium]